MLEINLLGRFEVHLDGKAVKLDSRPTQALLAYLVLQPATAQPRDKLAGVLWPDSAEENARSSLRHALWRLRKAIGDKYLQTDNSQITIVPGPGIRLDYSAFEADPRDQPVASLLSVVSTYHGELLPGFYEDWADLARNRIEAAFQTWIRTLLEKLIGAGRWEEVSEWSERWISFGHAPEPAFRALMQAHAARGDAAAIAATYQRCVEALSKEMGLHPSPETEALFNQLAGGERPFDTSDAGPSTALRQRRARHNLPASSTPFIGRQRDLDALEELIQQESVRLITLTGPGGIGKTRLALETAGLLVGSFEDGAWFVDLAPVGDPGLTISTIAATLGVTERGDQPIIDSLKSFLADRQLLLVLDNFEHLVRVAPAVSHLLAAAPAIKVLVTSRERLRLQGENDFPVSPLQVPDLSAASVDALHGFEAVRLFEDRAHAADRAFSLTDANAADIAQICRRLEGLPLAIELAAARIPLFTPNLLLERLETRLGTLTVGRRDAPARQQTMRSALEWSYSLLEEEERCLFNRLGIFTGGWMLEEARAVCQDGLPIDLVDGVSSLLDKSLIFRDNSTIGRFGMLEVLREFAMEKLRASDEYDDIAARHAKAFSRLAARGREAIEGPDYLPWITRLEVEHDNLRGALRWTGLGEKNLPLALRLVADTSSFWVLRGYLTEGYANTSTVLSRTGFDTDPLLLARATLAAAWLAYRLNHLDDARRLSMRGLELAQQIDDPILTGEALCQLGNVDTELGDYDSSPEKFRQAQALYRQASNLRGIAESDVNLAWVLIRTGDTEPAKPYLREAMKIFEEIGNQPGLGFALSALGEVCLRKGMLEEAQAHLRRSLEVRETLGDKWGMAATLGSLGWAWLLQGDPDEARLALTRSLSLRWEIGDIGGMAWCLEKLAEAADEAGETELAARLYGGAHALRDSVRSVIDPVDREAYGERLKRLRKTLGEAGFQDAWDEGASTPIRSLMESILQG
jgi:predicted ATPase/DNA-binding SARP family transcriptional activator